MKKCLKHIAHMRDKSEDCIIGSEKVTNAQKTVKRKSSSSFGNHPLTLQFFSLTFTKINMTIWKTSFTSHSE